MIPLMIKKIKESENLRYFQKLMPQKKNQINIELSV